MKTTLLIDITIDEICKGFVYNELEGKGLFGWSGKLVIQPEYQRNYLYSEAKMEEAVIHSVLNDLLLLCITLRITVPIRVQIVQLYHEPPCSSIFRLKVLS